MSPIKTVFALIALGATTANADESWSTVFLMYNGVPRPIHVQPEFYGDGFSMVEDNSFILHRNNCVFF